MTGIRVAGVRERPNNFWNPYKGEQVTLALGTSQKQLWALNNGELKATGDEFAFGTIRKNVEVYLSEIFAFHGML